MQGGIEIPRDDCQWRAGGLGNMANRCDGDQVVVGACRSGFNNDCPGLGNFYRNKIFKFYLLISICYVLKLVVLNVDL